MEKSWKIDVNNTFQPQLVVYSYPKNVREPKGVVFKILDHACYETKFGEKESRKGQCIACNTNFSTLENETEKNISDEKRAAVKQVPDKGIKDETENILIAVDVVKKSGLTSEECDAFIDYVICGIHTENIAAKKGVSKNAVRKQRSRARGKIEVFLKSLDDNRRY
jgi:DNA-directed RNA polymerase specialized sigma24 family protein